MLVSLVRPSPRLDPENICLVFGWINDREKRDKRKIITYQGVRKKREDGFLIFSNTHHNLNIPFLFSKEFCVFLEDTFCCRRFLD
jgi:hypothetical protein